MLAEAPRMADQSDVRRIALALPDTGEAEDRFAFFVRHHGRDGRVKEKSFAWSWMERVAPKRPRVPRDDVLAVRVANLEEKEALLALDAARFFTEPHYHGFPAVLVRLAAIEDDELEDLLADAWRCQAPRALLKALEDQAGAAGRAAR
jgi:hypothetical protein